MNTPNRYRPVSLRDIARRVGVSHATVSLALRDHPRISHVRIAEIRRVARELGYRPEPMLNILNAYRKGRAPAPVKPLIAWLNFWGEPRALRRFREFDGYWRGACETAEKCGFALEEFPIGRDVELERLDDELRRHDVCGVLIPPMPGGKPPGFDNWDWSALPVVRFGYSLADLPVHVVTSDQVAAGMTAFSRARDLGYVRVGLVMTDHALATTFFAAGFLCAQQQVSDGVRVPTLSLPARRPGSYARELTKWINRFKPDAIVTGVAELRECLASIGVRVPEDVGLAALSVLDGNADAGIDQQPEEIGRVAAETLISLFGDGQRGPLARRHKVLVSGRWVDGSTLPDRRNLRGPAVVAR